MKDLTLQSAKEEFGHKLKKVRVNKELSQAQVAEKANISVTYYAQIERGEVNPTFDVFFSLAKTLKIKLSRIIPF